MRASQSDTQLDHHKTVALLDVDETLISGNFIIDTSHSLEYIKGLINTPDVLNISLLNALKRAGVCDVYFFTDMTLNAIGMRERLALRAVMQEHGFAVHGVITPADSAWHLSLETMNSLLESNVSLLPKKIDNLRKQKTEESEAQAQAQAQQFLGQINADANYTRLVGQLNNQEPSLPGCAFASAEPLYDSQEQLRPLTEKSRSVKAFVDMQSVVENLSHVKGKMLEHFLAYNSRSQQPFTRCVVCDDREDVLLSIQEASQRSVHAIDTATILVNNLRRSKNPSSSQPAKSSKDFLEEMINIDIVTQLRDLVDTQSSLDESLKTELKNILASKNISQSQIDQLRIKIEDINSSDNFMEQFENIIKNARQISATNRYFYVKDTNNTERESLPVSIQNLYQSQLLQGQITATNNSESIQPVSGSGSDFYRAVRKEEACGKWLLDCTNEEVDELWKKILAAVRSGKLQQAKVVGIDDTGRYPNRTIIIPTLGTIQHIDNTYNYLVKTLEIDSKHVRGYKTEMSTLAQTEELKIDLTKLSIEVKNTDNFKPSKHAVAEHNNLSSASPLCLGVSRLALYGSATTGAALMLASGIAMIALGFLMIVASKGILSPLALLIMKKGILACASSVGLVSLGSWGFLGAGFGAGTVLVGASAYALRAA